MLVTIEGVLTAKEAEACRSRLAASKWVDGKITAGEQSARVKENLQIPEQAPVARELGELILGALGRNPTFVAAALPLRVFPPLFNRYDVGMGFGAHVDNAIRFAGPVRYRTDVSATLFLSDPEEYDGGELIVEDVYGAHEVKLSSGDLALYPATSLHRVAPVTRGSRWAAFTWVQSMIKADAQRSLLFDLDNAIRALTPRVGQDDAAVVSLTGTYHNLLRMWAEV